MVSTKITYKKMTTAEFIKMLQEADPSGNAHIRMSGGVPYMAESKPGYYDGPYEYIDKDGRFVMTNVGEKVDIWCKEPTDIVWDSDWNAWSKVSIEEEWENLKAKFVFDYSAYAVESQREERRQKFFDELRKTFDQWVKYEQESCVKYLDEVMEKYKKGWKFLQKKVGMKFYDWKIVEPNGSSSGANWATSAPILLSGKFAATERGEYIEWTPINE